MRTQFEERRIKPFGVAVILLAAAVLAGVYIIHVGRDMSDFGVCYQGGERIVRGETLYRESDGHLQYKYSPTSALFFAPLSLLPRSAARLLWYVLELGFLSGLLVLSFRVLPVPRKKVAPVLAWTFLIELKFLGRELELGQVNLFILFLLTAMLYQLVRQKETSSGILWAGSLFFKPYALVFLPYFLVKRRFRALGSGVAAALIGLSLPAFIYGIRGYLAVLREWPATLSKSTVGLLSSFDNASLYGFLLKAFPGLPKPGTISILLLIFLGMAIAVLWMIRKGREPIAPRNPEVLESAFLLVLIPLFSPLGWNYNYLYSLLAVLIVIAFWRQMPSALRILLIINFAAISTSLVELWGRELFRLYTHYALVAVDFLIVLVALLYLRQKNAA